MKKVLLSLGVIVIFVAYALTQRHHSNTAVATVASSHSGATASTASGDSSNTTSAGYKNGTYTGSVINAFYGNVQVSATISGGKLTAVTFLETPHDNQNSIQINDQAKPALQQEALQSQSSHVDIVSGATQTSQAFVQSLAAALSQATQG